MMLYKLGAEFGKLFPAPKTPNLSKLQPINGEIAEDKIVFIAELFFDIFTQERSTSPPKQRLQQLQILRI